MHKITFALAVFTMTAVGAQATTWVATCNDGKNLQYVQTVKGNGFLYLMVNKELYQTARLTQTFEGEATICGVFVVTDDTTGALLNCTATFAAPRPFLAATFSVPFTDALAPWLSWTWIVMS